MSEQNFALSEQMQNMAAQMAAMQAELDTLKDKSTSLTHINPPSTSTLTGTRRKTLKRLGLALLGGVTAATVTGFSVSEAKVTVSSKPLGTTNIKVGELITLPGVDAPTGTPTDYGQKYGLIASSSLSPLNLNNIDTFDTGVYGIGNDVGVYGTGDDYGVRGTSTSVGVYGVSSSNTGVYGIGYTGVYGAGTYGVFGSGGSYGVYGNCIGLNGTGVWGSGQAAGVFIGRTGGGTGSLQSNTTVGVIGSVGTNFDLSSIPNNYTVAIYGVAPSSGSNNFAGYFDGNVKVTGNLVAASKNFKIDHPLDPTNKYLYHTSVESPDMLNIYNGLVTLDEQGEAVIEMPEWFEALNADFRYQLTCLGQFAPVYIAEEIKARTFKIAGGAVGQKISWQVTGIRQDAYAKAYRSPIEEEKPADDKGTYLHPELFGQPEEMSVGPGQKVGR